MRRLRARGQQATRVHRWSRPRAQHWVAAALAGIFQVGCLELAAINAMAAASDEDDAAGLACYGRDITTREIPERVIPLGESTTSVGLRLGGAALRVPPPNDASDDLELRFSLFPQVRYPGASSSNEIRELPRVRFTLSSASNVFAPVEVQTDGAPHGTTAAEVSANLGAGQSSDEVAVPVDVTLERLDAAPFGDVEVELSGLVTLVVPECAPNPQPGLDLTWSNPSFVPPGSDAMHERATDDFVTQIVFDAGGVGFYDAGTGLAVADAGHSVSVDTGALDAGVP